MVALMMFVFVAGFIRFINLNIEAYPDTVTPPGEVITKKHGRPPPVPANMRDPLRQHQVFRVFCILDD
jgi:hypothetical protein